MRKGKQVPFYRGREAAGNHTDRRLLLVACVPPALRAMRVDPWRDCAPNRISVDDADGAVNGVDLFYRDTGSGEPLLLLHGFTGSGDDWKHVFADPIAGYRVIAPDLRGHGRSTNPGNGFRFGSEAEWAEMRARHHHGDDQIRALWRQIRAFADDRDDMNFTAATLSRISARTLIVHGDRDPLYPVELAVELLRGIPNAALWVVPNGGHGPIFGEQTAPFAATATTFLR